MSTTRQTDDAGSWEEAAGGTEAEKLLWATTGQREKKKGWGVCVKTTKFHCYQVKIKHNFSPFLNPLTSN